MGNQGIVPKLTGQDSEWRNKMISVSKPISAQALSPVTLPGRFLILRLAMIISTLCCYHCRYWLNAVNNWPGRPALKQTIFTSHGAHERRFWLLLKIFIVWESSAFDINIFMITSFVSHILTFLINKRSWCIYIPVNTCWLSNIQYYWHQDNLSSICMVNINDKYCYEPRSQRFSPLSLR